MCVTQFIGGHGSFAEECLVAADGAFPVPDGLTDAQAAGFWIPHLTGWIGLVDRGGIAAGDWLAVLGASGGSGIAAVQLGRALGARVVAVVSDDERAAFCANSAPRPPSTIATVRSRPRCASSPTGRASIWSTTRSAVRWPRTRPEPWRATGGCSRSASPAADGRTS